MGSCNMTSVNNNSREFLVEGLGLRGLGFMGLGLLWVRVYCVGSTRGELQCVVVM